MQKLRNLINLPHSTGNVENRKFLLFACCFSSHVCFCISFLKMNMHNINETWSSQNAIKKNAIKLAARQKGHKKKKAKSSRTAEPN